MTLDLATLPPPSVVETLDFEAILEAMRADLLARYPEAAEVLDLESEPLVKLLQVFAYRELLYRARVNDAASAHLLAFAGAADLDHLAALFGVSRMLGEPDERMRARLQLRIAALGAQGTREHYEFVAMSTSTNVRAASATQPRPGAVHVVLWLHAMDAQTPEMVVAALNADNALMLGVSPTVGVATPRAIDVRARVWRTAAGSPHLLEQLRERMAAAFASYAALGHGVARSWITTLLHAEGVAAIEFKGEDAPPVTTMLAGDEYPVLGTVQLTDAGVL